MYVAQIHHKLTRPEEDKEDLLTSNVFGLWKYLPLDTGLLEFLNTSKNLKGIELGLAGDVFLKRMDFWPWIQEGDAKGAQPDVLMELWSSGKRDLVLIESKYLSGKSSTRDDAEKCPTDQLAREMHNLRRLASRKRFDTYSLIYVTAGTSIPKDDILEATDELAKKTGRSEEANLYWTTWRHLPDILARAAGHCDLLTAALLNDLRTILEDMGLIYFRGVCYGKWVEWGTPYVFREPEIAFSWVPIDVEWGAPYVFRQPEAAFIWAPIDLVDDSYTFILSVRS